MPDRCVLGPVSGGEGGPSDGGLWGKSEQVGQDGAGHGRGELEQGGFAGVTGLDAAGDEPGAHGFGGHVLARDPAGEQPVVGSADVGGPSGAGEVVTDDLVERVGKFDGGGVEGNGHRVGPGGDLVGAHAADADRG